MRNCIIVSIVIFLSAGLTSCSIEKRHYRGGFYVDWNKSSAKTHETVALCSPPVVSAVPDRIVEAVDTVSALGNAKEQDDFAPKRETEKNPEVSQRSHQETPVDFSVNSEKTNSPTPLEKDKKQAVGAGIAAAIFFLLGMVGLIIKGTAPPVGVFIAAAFVCCILCIILASFLYPREAVVKQPKAEPLPQDRGIAAVGIGLLIAVFVICAIVAGLFLSIFSNLFF